MAEMGAQADIQSDALILRDRQGVELMRGTAEALLSDGQVLTTLDAKDMLDWRVEAKPDGVILRLVLRNWSRAPLHVEQLRLLIAPVGYRGLALADLRIQQTGWQSWSRTHPPSAFEPNAHAAAPPIRGPWLPHRASDSQLEPWMTLLEEAAVGVGAGAGAGASVGAGPSLLLGFVGARHQLGTIEILPTPDGGHALIAATELDGLELSPGSELVSEPLLVSSGATPHVLDLYADTAAASMAARQPAGEILSGWCSWYQLYASVSEADVDRNLDVLSRQHASLPLRLVQLDDGYQLAIGDWLDLNDKFPSGMRALVQRIRDRGFVPGLWLAPFLVSSRSRTFADHPDWVVRTDAADPVNAIDNWGSANYTLDTTHPGVLDWLDHVVHSVCDDWGFEYLKLDFLYAAAMRGRRFDSHVTGVGAYRRGLERLRHAAGERFILGCGAPLLPSVGLVDGMRIGSDVAAYWGEEGNSDGPSLLNATRATLARLWMHGRWWTNDPDCVIVRATDTRLTLAEVQAWASVVALSGGMLFVGDDLSQVEPERLALLARLLPPSGQAAHAYPPLASLLPARVHLRVERVWGQSHVVGIANWSDTDAFAVWDPRDFGLDAAQPYHLVDLWSGSYLGLRGGRLDLGRLPPHALRLLAVHPDLGRPRTVGSNGHLLGDGMDLADEHWDTASGILTLVPAAHGPRDRQGEFLVYDPRGPLRRVPFSVSDLRPIRLSFSGWG